MTEEEKPFFEEILKSEVITVRCKRCGSEQLMNKVYAPYVNALDDCKECRT